MSDVLILRSVFSKSGHSVFIQPCRNPITGQYPSHIRRVKYSNGSDRGEMILSEGDLEKMSNGEAHFIGEDEFIEIIDGTTFNLSDMIQRAKWEAIQYAPIIAKDRDEVDDEGNLVIDGSAKKYGIAELYVERPGAAAKTKVSKKRLVTRALNYIFEDNEFDRLTKAKVLGGGTSMKYRPDPDVVAYLMDIAESNPQKIIEIYTGEDFQLRLLLAEAIDKNVLYKKSGAFWYGDGIPLGATDDACLIWFKDPRNKKLLDLIKNETYPELQKKIPSTSAQDNIDALLNTNIAPKSTKVTTK